MSHRIARPMRRSPRTWSVVFGLGLVAAMLATGRLASQEPSGEDKAKDAESAKTDEFKFVAVEDFNEKSKLEWHSIRLDPTHYSLAKQPGKLTITTQRGSIHGDEKNDAFGEGLQAKNLFLIAFPVK